MRRSFTIPNVKFPSTVIRESLDKLAELIPQPIPGFPNSVDVRTMQVSNSVDTWSFDSFDEFAGQYDQTDTRNASIYAIDGNGECSLDLRIGFNTDVSVRMPERGPIMAIGNIFSTQADQYRRPEESSRALVSPKPRIFIGHGHDAQWSELKNHLTDKHDLDVQAFEVGARAGHAIRDILEELMASSSFAILVMTGEDESSSGEMRARENVVHETGLFQGKLGFARAVVLVEEDVKPYSNLDGIQHLGFAKGRIRETFGDVLATLRREFGPL